jgi:hypothetical protein
MCDSRAGFQPGYLDVQRIVLNRLEAQLWFREFRSSLKGL